MVDLVARLRDKTGYWHEALRNEAADEIDRLQAAKRRALQVADERAKENVRLRAIVRVNGLRWGHTHAEIDALLDQQFPRD